MKSLIKIITITALMFAVNTQAGDVNLSKLAKKKQTPQALYLTAKEAYSFKMANPKALLVDVRTPSELEFVGTPKDMDANIPYVVNDFSEFDAKKSRFKKVPNSNFTVALSDLIEAKNLNKSAEIILICRSGSRSAKAANLLDMAGYKNVYSVVDGFEGGKAKSGPNKGQRTVNGWKNAGLPWTYKLKQAKMYFD